VPVHHALEEYLDAYIGAAGITAYLENGGTMEHAQQIAADDEAL
jgi:hypothetical protein